jgi:hypothetical protein
MDKKYGFEPFEAAISLIPHGTYQPCHEGRGKIIKPKVIALKDWMPIHTEIDAPKLAALLNAARDWYQTTGRRYDEEMMAGFNEALDQLMADFEGMKYIQTEPVGFYQYLADLYIALPGDCSITPVVGIGRSAGVGCFFLL